MRHFVILLLIASLFSIQQNSYAALQISEAQRLTFDQFFTDEPLHAKWTALLQSLPESENMDLQIITAQTAFKAGSSRIKVAINNIDDTRIKQLENNYATLQRKYAPLLTHYKSLNVQFSTLPVKAASAFRKSIRLQINTLRPAVFIARTSLSSSRNRVQTARKLRAMKMTTARTKWRSLQGSARNFTLSKARIKLQESHLRTEWKSLLKQKDRSTAAVSLAICSKFSIQLASMKHTYLNQLVALNQQMNLFLKQL
jgi:ABC-type phosphate transport system auxiliary subunit